MTQPDVLPRHVDDFIDDPKSDLYAAQWFDSFRRPAIDKLRHPVEGKLFATWKGKRYRVTGCSRLGDIWLHSDLKEDTQYEHRVSVDDCSGWGDTPSVKRPATPPISKPEKP